MLSPQRGFLHEPQEPRQFLAGLGAFAPDLLQIDPGGVDGVPHLAGQRGADRARIQPRVFDAVLDRRGIAWRERQIIDDVVLIGFVVSLVKACADARGQQRRIPFVGLADIGVGQRGDAQRRLDGAREIFRPLDIAGQPVQIFSGARQHAGMLLSSGQVYSSNVQTYASNIQIYSSRIQIYSSRIQVSLVPPPWLEFTTSEPSFSATRVSPPGTIVT